MDRQAEPFKNNWVIEISWADLTRPDFVDYLLQKIGSSHCEVHLVVDEEIKEALKQNTMLTSLASLDKNSADLAITISIPVVDLIGKMIKHKGDPETKITHFHVEHGRSIHMKFERAKRKEIDKATKQRIVESMQTGKHTLTRLTKEMVYVLLGENVSPSLIDSDITNLTAIITPLWEQLFLAQWEQGLKVYTIRHWRIVRLRIPGYTMLDKFKSVTVEERSFTIRYWRANKHIKATIAYPHPGNPDLEQIDKQYRKASRWVR